MASYLTYDAPAEHEHPRLWINEDNGPTLAQVQARIYGTYSSYWSSLSSYASSHLADTSKYSLGWWDGGALFSAESNANGGREPEYVLSLCAKYLLDVTLTSVQKAAYHSRMTDIALSLAARTSSSDDQYRYRMAGMAFIYDWGYDDLSAAERTTIRNAIVDCCEYLDNQNAEEYVWGHNHGNSDWALLGYLAILGDGEDSGTAKYTKAGIVSAFETLLDYYDDGGTGESFLPVFRHFGDTDGGTHKGSGSGSYHERNCQFHARLWPALKSAVGMDWWTDEDWWLKSADWVVWHFRNDNNWHRQGDCNQQAPHSLFTQVFLYQVAQQEGATARGNAAQFFANYIQDASTASYSIWGPYNIYRCLHMDATLGTTYDAGDPEGGSSPAPPTLAGYNSGNQMKVFTNAGKVCIRDNFLRTGSSLTISAPKYFLNGHQHRDGGHFTLAFNNQVLTEGHGHYRPSRDGDPINRSITSGRSGHRRCFNERLLGKNTVRIYDPNEVTENEPHSVHHWNTEASPSATNDEFGAWNTGNTVFTTSNTGDQQWPKRVGVTDGYLPWDLDDLDGGAAISAWVYDSLIETDEQSSHCYVVANLLPLYYSSKVTRFKRHFLWIKAGQISGWSYPVLVVWDDITVPDTGCIPVCQVQHFTGTTAAISSQEITMAGMDYDGVESNEYVCEFVKPASGLTLTNVEGYFDHNGQDFGLITADGAQTYDDDGYTSGDRSPTDKFADRVDVKLTTPATDTDFLHVYFWQPTGAATRPELTLVEDGSYMGVQFDDGLIAKFAKGDTHSVVVSSDPPPTAPSAPSLSVDSTTQITVSWTEFADPDSDFQLYSIERSTYSGGAWGSWSEVKTETTLATTSWINSGISAGTTYRYRMRIKDDADQYSDYSASASATTESEPPASESGSGVAPWRVSRTGKFSKYLLDLN